MQDHGLDGRAWNSDIRTRRRQTRVRQVGFWMMVAGALGVLWTFTWSFHFYRKSAAVLAKADIHLIECWYQLSGPCRAISDASGSTGAFSYEPLFFWVSLVGLMVGIAFWFRGITHAIAGLFAKR